jgi:hypothetical protein
VNGIVLAFTWRLLAWVSLVVNGASGLRIVDQNSLAIHSAIGATARAQVGAVSDKRTANDPISRRNVSPLVRRYRARHRKGNRQAFRRIGILR